MIAATVEEPAISVADVVGPGDSSPMMQIDRATTMASSPSTRSKSTTF
jgi:hypothetical protein